MFSSKYKHVTDLVYTKFLSGNAGKGSSRMHIYFGSQVLVGNISANVLFFGTPLCVALQKAEPSFFYLWSFIVIVLVFRVAPHEK